MTTDRDTYKIRLHNISPTKRHSEHCYSRKTEPYNHVPPHINPPSTYMHPPLEYTQPPLQVPVIRPTSGYATSHGYSVLPPEANRPTSSVSRTVTHNPTDSQPLSSSSTSQLGMSSLRLQGNSSEPNTPTTNQSATPGQVLTQVGVRDMHNRLVIEPNGYTFNPDDAVGIISQAIKDLYRDAFPTWGKMPSNLKRQIFLEFRIGKKARSSTKGGSLHTSGAQSQGSVRRKLEKELGRPVTQAEAFKATHIRKKKNPEDPDVWVEPRAEMTYLWRIYDKLRQKKIETFREYHSEFEGLSSSYDDESMKKNLAMEQKIAELSSQVEDSRARERRRDLEYAGLKAQFDALLASGGIPLCSNDVTFPPRPSQSQPTRYPVYGQQRNMTDESSSDEEDEDHVANTLPH
ncbi:hypothetical protein KY290_037337 [Solanum tuberosum]|uniref:Uncharacterized protein n=1 Tax=Solanum tuberosum TaxID=4113 RepID=A0ABQ7TWZ8_SOLTU|nr:hypothetical protein KY285_036635 [Solanum tuberosum]KAH0738632.1 hypothetical protein KY290_037337 [Solanum tuberosum]